MIVWTAINSAATAILMLALYLTIRQVGLLLTHLGPGGARASDLGPRLGENISPYTASLGAAQDTDQRRTLFIFATEFCPACATVRDAAQTIAKHWAAAARVVMVYDALSTGNGAANRTRGLVLTANPTLRVQLDIRAVPYAVVTDASWRRTRARPGQQRQPPREPPRNQ
jgi:hypothetical protein